MDHVLKSGLKFLVLAAVAVWVLAWLLRSEQSKPDRLTPTSNPPASNPPASNPPTSNPPTKNPLWQKVLILATVLLVMNVLVQEGLDPRYGSVAPADLLPFGSVVGLLRGPLALALIGVAGVAAVVSLGASAGGGRVLHVAVLGPYMIAWLIGGAFGRFPGLPLPAVTALCCLVPFAVLPLLAAPELSRRLARWIAHGALLSSLLMAVVLPSWAWAPYQIWPGGWRGDVPRLQGIMPHPNALGWMAVLALVIAATDDRGSRFRRSLMCAAGGALLLSGSRSATLALVMAWIAVTLGVRKDRTGSGPRHRSGWVVAALGVVVALAFWKVSESPNVSSFNGRTATWRQALDTFLTSPVVGSGPAAYIERDGLSGAIPYAHDQVLHTLAELGLVGLVALTIHLVGVLRIAAKAEDRLRIRAVVAVWVLLFITENLLRFTTVVFALPVALWMLCLASSPLRVNRQNHPGREHPGREHPGREHPGQLPGTAEENHASSGRDLHEGPSPRGGPRT